MLALLCRYVSLPTDPEEVKRLLANLPLLSPSAANAPPFRGGAGESRINEAEQISVREPSDLKPGNDSFWADPVIF